MRYTGLSLCCLAIIFGSGCGDSPEPVAPPPPEVSVLTVAADDVPVSFEFVGKTRSSRRVEIRSRVEGFLEQRSYVEGSMVQDGDLLFQMDRKPFEVQLSAAKAELAQQQARLTNARANLRRVKPLAEQNAVAQKELDDALGVFRSAAASVEAAQAKVVQAELDLGYTEIHSPVTGLASFAIKREGSYIGFNDSLLTYVAQIQPMWVEFSISENQAFQFKAQLDDGLLIEPDGRGFDIEIILADGTKHPEQGRITFADASLSEETGTYLLRGEIGNPRKNLRPGQFVRVQLLGGVRPDAILVPKKTIQQGAKGSFVWVVDDQNVVKFQPIVTGPWLDDQWFINQGLQQGDRVIVDGALKVRAGLSVETVPYSAADDAEVGR